MTRSVRKRDGETVQPFDVDKIIKAVRGAWNDVGGLDESKLAGIAKSVVSALPSDDVLDVEEIQDIVEIVLMRKHLFAVAKAYILYRDKRAVLRGARQHPDPLAVSSFIHAAKYAKYIPEIKRREVFLETVQRDKEMHLRRFSHIPGMVEEIEQAFKFVEEKKLLPSMRSFQFGGKAIETNNARGFNCSFSFVDRPRVFAEALFLLLSGCGVGYSVQFEHVDKLPSLKFIDEKRVVHHVVEDTIEGWADALDALVNSYVEGYYLEISFHKIRPAGSPLKTSGGKAPGHIKLKQSLKYVRDVLRGAEGRKLRPIECHRIMCHAADAVLSGGIRRSAMIALFSLDDSEMVYAKTGDWWKTNPWYANANNSVMLKRDDVTSKQFKRIFQMTREFGEPGFDFVSDLDHGFNPCQPAWAPLLTPEGVRILGEVEVGSTIWSGKRWTRVSKKWSTGVKPVFAYHTRAGTFYGTEKHRVVCEGEKIEVGSAEAIDITQGPAPVAESLNTQTIMDGLVLGDGSVHQASNDLVFLCIGEDDRDYHESEVREHIKKHRPGISGSYSWEISTTIIAAEIPLTYLRKIPSRFRFGTSATVRAFLRGLYSANGSIVDGRVTLKAASFDVIQHVQEMLSSIGIASYYTTNRATRVLFENGEYLCRESYDLNITHGRNEFRRLIGFLQRYKQEKLDEICDRQKSKYAHSRKKETFEIVEKTSLGEEEVFDIAVEDEEHTYWTGGLLVSNCNEIGLNAKLVINDDVMGMLERRVLRGKPLPSVKLGDVFSGWSFCNLCEINGEKLKSLDDFLAVAKEATLIGTLQADYTNFPYLGWVSEVIAEREALLGIGITGMMDSPQITLNPEYQRTVATKIVEWNKEYAARIGIRQAARTTTVKPSGTTSLALGSVASGHHPHHARRYIRRVIADELETVFQAFREVNPGMCQLKPDGKWVIEFPVEAPDGAIVKSDLSAIEFLDSVKSTQQNWVLPGTARPESSPGLNHNVSNTVTVKPEEWDAVADYLWENRAFFTGVSLLPEAGDVIYAFAPFQAILTEADEARWNQLLASYKPVDYTTIIEEDDATNVAQEPACAGGTCEIPT